MDKIMSEFVVPYSSKGKLLFTHSILIITLLQERNLRPSCVSDESAVGSRGKDSGNVGKDDSLSIHDFP
ncbi:unnamed protein product [Rhizophagus irregularis]|nr:unnamed protein product [Rhizophagus irregularis]